jgi:thiosulfate/3-mercaptopyruvate sulfurtransferase
MKKTIILIAVLIAAAGNTFSQGDIITAADFMNVIKANKNLVIIDANTADEYAKSHVLNAVNIWHVDLYKPGSIEGLIKSPQELADIFGKKGVSNTNSIVVYDDGSNKYSTRIYWILKYLGASDVKVLTKDMEQWKVVRVPITRNPTTVKSATFTPGVNADIIVDMNYVKAHLSDPNVMIFDAREKAEFDGTDGKSKGHIKGAKNMDYKECLTANGSFKSAAELETLAKKYGISKDKTLVFYCITSVRAAAPFLAFKSILGYPNVKVYDGAYNEWVANNLPLEK